MRRAPSGFTLIEVVIATTLAAVIIAAFYQLLGSQTRIAAEEVQDTAAQTALVASLSPVLPLLEEGKPKTDGPLDPACGRLFVQFRTPMKDIAGNPATTFNTKSGLQEFEFGAGDPGTMLKDSYYRIVFEPGYDSVALTGRADSLIDESTIPNSNNGVGVDLNGDGDVVDQYMFGTLMLRQFDPAGNIIHERSLGGRMSVPWPNGEIFNLSGRNLNITLTYIDMRQKPEDSRMRQTKTGVAFRN